MTKPEKFLKLLFYKGISPSSFLYNYGITSGLIMLLEVYELWRTKNHGENQIEAKGKTIH